MSLAWLRRPVSIEALLGFVAALHIATLACARAPIESTAFPLVAVGVAVAVKRRRFALSPLLALVAAHLAWGVVTFASSSFDYPWTRLDRLAPWLVVFAFAAGLPVRHVAFGLRLLIGIAVLGAIYGVVQHFTGVDLFFGGRSTMPITGSAVYHSKGFLFAHHHLGNAAPAWIAFATVFFLDAWRRGATRHMAILGAALAALIAVLFFSYSRAGWIAGAIVLCVAPFVVRVRRAWLLPVVLLALAAVALAVEPELRARLATLLSVEANTDRAHVFDVNRRLLAAMPWTGIGYGAYETAARPLYESLYSYLSYWNSTHNDFFQVIIETGVPGIIIYVAMWIAFFVRATRRLWGRGPSRVDGEPWLWTAAAFIFGIAFQFSGLGHNALKCYEAASLVALAFAIVAAPLPSETASGGHGQPKVALQV